MIYDFNQLQQDTGKTEDELLGIAERRKSLDYHVRERTKYLRFLCEEIENEVPDVKSLKNYRDDLVYYTEKVDEDLDAIEQVLRCSIVLMLQDDEDSKLIHALDLTKSELETISRKRKLRILATL